MQQMPDAHPHLNPALLCSSMPGATVANTSSTQWTSEAVGHPLRLLPSRNCYQLRRPDFQSFSGSTCLFSFSCFEHSNQELRDSSECLAAESRANCSSSSFDWVADSG